MTPCSEKHIHCGIERNLSNNQNFKKIKPKLIDVLMLKLVYEERPGKSFMKSFFCRLCNQIIPDKSMACHVLFKDQFAKVIQLVRKAFCFCLFCDIYI